MKVIFHCHTDESSCSDLKVEELIDYAKVQGIKKIFLTNHNKVTIPEGYRDLFVPSIEITTKQGDIIGIFVDCLNVSSVESMEKTIDNIKEAGGLVVAPHPGDIVRSEAMKKRDLLSVIEKVDIIEVFNGRNLFSNENWLKNIAAKYKKHIIWGSDAHSFEELGNVIIDMPVFNTKNELLVALQVAKTTSKNSSGLSPHFKTLLRKLLN